MAMGAFCAGFGPGSFKLIKVDEPLADNQLEFKLQDHNDLVVLNNNVLPLGTVVAQQRELKPDIEINYHKIAMDATKAGEFTVTQTHRVVYFLKESTNEISQNNIANKEAFKAWFNAEAVVVLWVVRWTQKGLQPVRPEVRLRKSLVLAPEHACKLTGAST